MSIEYVNTKKRFVVLVNKMEKPVLCSGSADELNINKWFVVQDDANYKNSFNLPGCHFYNSNKESLEEYEKREAKLTIKYENWMCYVCGEHYQNIKQ